MSYIGLRRAVNERGGKEGRKEGGRGAEIANTGEEEEEDGRQTRGEEQADPRRPGGRRRAKSQRRIRVAIGMAWHGRQVVILLI